MSIEADFYNTNAKFKSLEIDKQEGYQQTCLYKIVWQSAVLSGLEIGWESAEKLFKTGYTSSESKLSDYEMLYGLFEAYNAAADFAKTNKVLTYNEVNTFWQLSIRRMNYFTTAECVKISELTDFCERMNIKCQNFTEKQPLEQYSISYEAYDGVFNILPWSVANFRMARLMSHFFQFRFSLYPTNFLYIPKDKSDFLQMHIKNLNMEISEFLTKN